MEELTYFQLFEDRIPETETLEELRYTTCANIRQFRAIYGQSEIKPASRRHCSD